MEYKGNRLKEDLRAFSF